MRFLRITALQGICLWFSSLFFAACSVYHPPFTHNLHQGMTFAEVLSVAQEKGYGSFCEIADYRGYRLLCFKGSEGRRDVFLVVNKEGAPMLRSFEYGLIDKTQLVNFVDDLLMHDLG